MFSREKIVKSSFKFHESSFPVVINHNFQVKLQICLGLWWEISRFYSWKISDRTCKIPQSAINHHLDIKMIDEHVDVHSSIPFDMQLNSESINFTFGVFILMAVVACMKDKFYDNSICTWIARCEPNEWRMYFWWTVACSDTKAIKELI